MDHEKLKALLAAEEYGDNSPEESRLIQRHLETCEECQKQVAAWRKVTEKIQSLSVPQDESFWIRQRTAIMERLPKVPAHAGLNWHRWAGPAMALGVLVSVWGYREQKEHTALRIAQNMDMLQNMEMLQQLDVVEDLDVMEARSR